MSNLDARQIENRIACAANGIGSAVCYLEDEASRWPPELEIERAACIKSVRIACAKLADLSEAADRLKKGPLNA